MFIKKEICIMFKSWEVDLFPNIEDYSSGKLKGLKSIQKIVG
jgi:hypothetical protein